MFYEAGNVMATGCHMLSFSMGLFRCARDIRGFWLRFEVLA